MGWAVAPWVWQARLVSLVRRAADLIGGSHDTSAGVADRVLPRGHGRKGGVAIGGAASSGCGSAATPVVVHVRFRLRSFAEVKTYPRLTVVTPMSVVPLLKAPSRLSPYLFHLSG